MIGSRQKQPLRADLRLVAQPASVPAARRFVDDALSGWGLTALVEDVGLCVSELATNATLHSGSAYFAVELEKRPGGLRIAVADTGMGPVDMLARQPGLNDLFLRTLTADETSATGRGIFLVSVLASSWGIDELPDGKRVWAEFGPEVDQPSSGHPAPSDATVLRSPTRAHPELDPGAWAVVSFRDCPAALLVAHDDNIAEYTRELQLIGDRLSETSYQRLASVLADYVTEHAPNWDAARIMAREAVREGRELTDIDVVAPRDVRERLRKLRRLIEEAEALSASGRLMTLPAPEPVQRLRDWLEGEFVAQVDDAVEPLPWPDWLAGTRR